MSAGGRGLRDGAQAVSRGHPPAGVRERRGVPEATGSAARRLVTDHLDTSGGGADPAEHRLGPAGRLGKRFSRPSDSVSVRLGSGWARAFPRDVLLRLSYLLCYHVGMPQRDKRSVSFPPDLAKAIDAAAAESGTSFSAWIADTASHRLRSDAGRRGVAEWEGDHGPLSERELAEGLARARELLGRTASKRSA
jgi:hypothetical protein